MSPMEYMVPRSRQAFEKDNPSDDIQLCADSEILPTAIFVINGDDDYTPVSGTNPIQDSVFEYDGSNDIMVIE